MTAPRPIRPIDGNALEYHIRHRAPVYLSPREIADLVKNAPTLPQPEPVAEGDAISRERLRDALSAVHNVDGYLHRTHVFNTVNIAPSIPCAQPEAGPPSLEGDGYETCTVEECTHARLATGEIVGVSHFTNRQPYAKVNSFCYPNLDTWERLGITPVRLAKPEPGPTPTPIELLKRIEPILWEYKNQNPKHEYNGREQDPMGVHSLVEEVKAAIERERKVEE